MHRPRPGKGGHRHQICPTYLYALLDKKVVFTLGDRFDPVQQIYPPEPLRLYVNYCGGESFAPVCERLQSHGYYEEGSGSTYLRYELTDRFLVIPESKNV